MNRFMFLNKRKFSAQDIKSLYPKCINCINFKKENLTCKKFIIHQNYIDNDSPNDFALNVRNDNTRCGESGKLFDIGKEKLEKDNAQILNTLFGWTLATSVLTFVTQEFVIVFIPATISFCTYLIYFFDYYDYNKKIDNEKKRIEDYNNFLNKIKE